VSPCLIKINIKEYQIIKNDSWHNMRFDRWDNLDTWKPLASIKIIDTTNASINQVASQVKDWIDSIDILLTT